jgi:hypothetical protein
MGSVSTQIEDYLDGVSQLRLAVAGMTPEQQFARPIAGKWSAQEVVCHLVDSEQAWCHRMKRVIAEERPLLISYDESCFARSLRYSDRDPREELDLLEGMRRQMAQILRGLPEEAWSRPGVHSERGLMDLREMLRIETEHLAHHIRFIREKRRALGLDATGEKQPTAAAGEA